MNDSPTKKFSLFRGLRQNNYMSHFSFFFVVEEKSPFLFLLVVEDFHSLMSASVQNDMFLGYKVGSRDDCGVSTPFAI